MPPKQNPAKLNPLQLRTLTVLQALGRLPDASSEGPGPGEVTIARFPNAHGDHFHLGEATVSGKDMTGLFNEKVWHALERKGVARSDWPRAITLTKAGREYDTGLYDQILHAHAH